MATYKVLQDIEAEDKLIGPLTPRQCVYAAIALVSCYVSYLLIAEGVAFLAVFLLPFIGFGFFFAFPWRQEQSTEVWALARVRFALKPRRRIWDQNGAKNLVTVTAPVTYTRPSQYISQREVVSRLNALANTIDSRGWAVKNVPVTMYANGSGLSASDRLMGASAMPGAAPGPGSYDSTDIFDVAANPLAGELDAKMAAAATVKHDRLMAAVDNPGSAMAIPQIAAAPQQTWYTAAPTPVQQPAPTPAQPNLTAVAAPVADQTADTPAATAMPAAPAKQINPTQPTFTTVPVAGDPTPEEQALLARLRAEDQRVGSTQIVKDSYSDIRAPGLPAVPAPAPVQTGPAAVTPTVNPAILELANNNDLNIATIAREAQQITNAHPAGTLGVNQREPGQAQEEVHISLR
ncbi:MAG TPA: PrgI family protein [Candidatus Saccharimonadales bacterium]|nr:PrgI family protein [Candidatus Saccharimonadales bacterium]